MQNKINVTYLEAWNKGRLKLSINQCLGISFDKQMNKTYHFLTLIFFLKL